MLKTKGQHKLFTIIENNTIFQKQHKTRIHNARNIKRYQYETVKKGNMKGRSNFLIKC
jgi:hypothetical protein